MTFIAVLVVGSLVTLVVLAVATVRATDRLHALADRLLAARHAVEPALADLTAEADRARAHAERLRTARVRPGDGTTTDG